ncbi:NADH:quinone oxidoreductase [Pseudomonas alkylphenolica]|uniref:NADH:quinone oxidoreductase n=1 Tax=Pseudomonas alkylphenolica TaxID=237609 RepID=A0A443ZSW0_9PSED|nr:Rnf-Nqr domain containing protein [Pseudomonas alkylphenolica]RWU22434.1 NADH:quinone oxidoreductase [Pseudomonas alkylphenolica]
MNRHWLAAVSLALMLGATQTLLGACAIAIFGVSLITLHHLLLNPLQRWLEPRARMVASVLLAAMLATCLDLGLRAWALPLYQSLSPYPALIAVQCVVFQYAQGEQRRWQSVAQWLGAFAGLCVALGACREVLAGWASIRLVALLPGALLLLGLLLALYNRVCLRHALTRRQGKR